MMNELFPVTKTSRLFDLNYVFETRWGEATFEKMDTLELSDLAGEMTITIPFLHHEKVMLGRGPSAPTNDLEDSEEEERPTMPTVSADFRAELLALANATEADRQRAEQLEKTDLPLVDLQRLQADVYGVSRKHAVLELDEGRVTLTDMRSTNGTRLNGAVLFPLQRRILRNGDEINLGNLKLRVTFVKSSR